MRALFRITTTGFIWLYTILIASWLLGRYLYGDTIWWLALVNAFAPFLFAPLLFFLSLGFRVRTRSYWLGLALPSLIFVTIYGRLFLPRWPIANAAGSPPLTIMTFNIWSDSTSRQTAQVIRQNKLPDIVALQELSPAMVKPLLDEVGAFYPYHIFDLSRHDGLGVLSRYPLTELRSKHFFALGWQIQLLRVDVGERHFVLYNCHPRSSNVIYFMESGQSIADEVQFSYKLRAVLIKQLLDDLAERTDPVIVAGDLNSTPQSDVYHRLTNKLGDAQREAGWGFGHTYPAYTLYFRHFPFFPRLVRIDMILHSTDFVALNSQVSPLHGESDHLPVVAQLGWQQ